jgi:hypothetical protein
MVYLKLTVKTGTHDGTFGGLSAWGDRRFPPCQYSATLSETQLYGVEWYDD